MIELQLNHIIQKELMRKVPANDLDPLRTGTETK